ncbi:uncharacterized protein RAG0_13161 [Rhynchosporium agropyri]|uniref:Uncharacterized protein n=1 Tax=Rhynchosporium agropyri TaxID=914238 RepID=A0A1E1LBB0_9HELO|nr:uncharacterized protein RAG0_13161 [Rhynchosporium agropyri]
MIRAKTRSEMLDPKAPPSRIPSFTNPLRRNPITASSTPSSSNEGRRRLSRRSTGAAKDTVEVGTGSQLQPQHIQKHRISYPIPPRTLSLAQPRDESPTSIYKTRVSCQIPPRTSSLAYSKNGGHTRLPRTTRNQVRLIDITAVPAPASLKIESNPGSHRQARGSASTRSSMKTSLTDPIFDTPTTAALITALHACLLSTASSNRSLYLTTIQKLLHKICESPNIISGSSISFQSTAIEYLISGAKTDNLVLASLREAVCVCEDWVGTYEFHHENAIRNKRLQGLKPEERKLVDSWRKRRVCWCGEQVEREREIMDVVGNGATVQQDRSETREMYEQREHMEEANEVVRRGYIAQAVSRETRPRPGYVKPKHIPERVLEVHAEAAWWDNHKIDQSGRGRLNGQSKNKKNVSKGREQPIETERQVYQNRKDRRSMPTYCEGQEAREERSRQERQDIRGRQGRSMSPRFKSRLPVLGGSGRRFAIGQDGNAEHQQEASHQVTYQADVERNSDRDSFHSAFEMQTGIHEKEEPEPKQDREREEQQSPQTTHQTAQSAGLAEQRWQDFLSQLVASPRTYAQDSNRPPNSRPDSFFGQENFSALKPSKSAAAERHVKSGSSFDSNSDSDVKSFADSAIGMSPAPSRDNSTRSHRESYEEEMETDHHIAIAAQEQEIDTDDNDNDNGKGKEDIRHVRFTKDTAEPSSAQLRYRVPEFERPHARNPPRFMRARTIAITSPSPRRRSEPEPRKKPNPTNYPAVEFRGDIYADVKIGAGTGSLATALCIPQRRATVVSKRL